eukprot:CAMPEP_0173140412 /NCGR_PEP_ID=MMETSP1105-20130129/4874_1 /TAXON_ID=2985 /ORGANISM="Ochromonas sp., Strain BG-1" /LENGTH=181 /DNA_ID=CAMNT_0014053401 /DNA_START=40 /DNA_END=582 /DNA_ORIENTATION=+
MSILEYNGGAVIGMVGKDCVGICCDLRLGAQAQTVSNNFPKVFQISQTLFVGLTGLATDVLSLHQTLVFRSNLYKLREERDLSPTNFAALLSSLLYEKRFGPWFCEPIVVGLENGEPFLTSMDLIGAPMKCDDFVVSGTCKANLYGTCESLFRPDLSPEELFEVLSQCMLAAVDRDALSGW